MPVTPLACYLVKSALSLGRLGSRVKVSTWLPLLGAGCLLAEPLSAGLQGQPRPGSEEPA